MKPSLLPALAGLLLMCAGCQSMSWIAKDKPAKENAIAQNTAVRDVPWTWGKKRDKHPGSADVPPEIAAKFKKSQPKANGLESATEFVLEGNQAEVERNFLAARRAYESALKVDPDNADAHHRLGILADMRQEYDTAQDHYEAALRQKPHDANLLSDFGYSHHLRGNTQQSERYLLMALDLDGQHKQALKNLGSLYASQSRPQDALQAFRRFRSEAEAQQLLSQYFPNAANNGGGTNPTLAARAASESRPAPSVPNEEVSVETLRQMTPEQIFQLMEQRRQEAVRVREQKELAEMRPNLQNSLSEDEYPMPMSPANHAAAPAQDDAWAQQPPAPSNPHGGSSVPWSLGPGGNASNARPPSMDVAASPPSTEQPFWNGAPLSPRNAAPPPANNYPPYRGHAAAGGPPSGYNVGSADNASMSPPPWWANEAVGNSGTPTSSYPAHEFSSQPAASAAFNAAWNSPTNAPGANDLSSRQRAYQLAMSAGPGTMFPVLPADAAPASEVNWGTDTSNSYQEVRATSGWESPAQGSSPGQWQDAPTQLAPRSPTDNWNPPSSTSWPPAREAAPSSRGTAPMPPDQNRLPVINPGPVWNAAPGGPAPQGRSNATSRNSRSNTESEVDPAWWNSPAGQPGSNGATPVQQWPYAPR